MLIDESSLKLNFLRKTVAYHTPCDLGRGSGVYTEPKDVLRYVTRLQKTDFEDENSLCCGGSLGNMKTSHLEKTMIARDAAIALTKGNPDILATSCPLCKKTLGAVTGTKVADISEIVAEALILPQIKRKKPGPHLKLKEPASIY
jgi:Fe-S oxidoreductase